MSLPRSIPIITLGKRANNYIDMLMFKNPSVIAQAYRSYLVNFA